VQHPLAHTHARARARDNPAIDRGYRSLRYAATVPRYQPRRRTDHDATAAIHDVLVSRIDQEGNTVRSGIYLNDQRQNMKYTRKV
jgi:hypothetical protein